MLYSSLKNKLLKIQKGQFHSVLWERSCKTKKVYGNNVIIKRSSAVVRFGVEYDNIQAVQEKRASGELPAQNSGLQWGQWLLYPYFIKHKDNIYLRCSTVPNTKVKSEYFLNGAKVSFEQVENMLLASEKNAKKAEVFTINIDNILSI